MAEPEPDHDHDQSHNHDHAPERGWKAGFRYFKLIRQFWRSAVNDAVVDLIDPQPGERLLDIGAGMGAGTVGAASRVGGSRGRDDGHVIAVDPLPGMRALLNLRRLRPGRFGRITVLEGTAEALPVPDASIDAAWATNALHHFDDIEEAARELARVVSQDGRVVMVEEQFTDPSHPSYERFGGDEHEQHSHRFHAVDLEHVSTVMSAAGFEVVTAADTRVAEVPVKLIRLRRS